MPPRTTDKRGVSKEGTEMAVGTYMLPGGTQETRMIVMLAIAQKLRR